MGAAVNKDNFLGTMLPNVKITKITLDNTYTDGQIGKADDHTVTGRQITIKAEFYEQIDNNGNLSYLSASGFEKYISFRAVAICGEHSAIAPGVAYEPIKNLMHAEVSDTNMLKNNISILKQGGYATNSIGMYNILFNMLRKRPGFENNMKLVAQQAEEDNITPFAIKVGALSSQYMLELIKTTPSFQGPGGEVHAIPFEISIELDPAEYDNKAVLVFSEFDFDTFMEDWPEFGQHADVQNVPTFYGTPALQVLKIDGQNQYTKPVFHDNGGNQWFGGVTSEFSGQNDQELVIYADKLTTPPLELTVTYMPLNNYVDNTVFHKMDNLTIDKDFIGLDNQFINSLGFHNESKTTNISGIHNFALAKDIHDSLSLNEKPSIFSDLYMTRSTNGTGAAAVGMFTVDLKEIFAFRSSFSMPFKNNNIINPEKYMRQIIAMSKLSKFKVYRERVFDQKVDNNSKKELIIDVPLETFGGNLLADNWKYKMKHLNKLDKGKLPKDYSKYSGNESNTPVVQKVSINTTGNTEFLMHFNIYDPTVPTDSSSLSENGLQYAYSVEIVIEDGSSKYIKSKYNDLLNTSKTVGKIVELTNIVNRTSPEEGFYNDVTDKFTTKFTGFPQEDLDNRVDNYVGILNIFASKPGNGSLSVIESLDNLKKNMINALDPTRASRDDYILFKNRLDNLLNQLVKFTNTKKPSRLSEFNSYKDPATDSNDTKKRYITVKNTFKHTFDANMLRNTGYEYIPMNAAPAEGPGLVSQGLFMMTPHAFNLRATNETLKYFKEQDQSVSITMSAAQVSAKTYNFGNTSANEVQYFSPSFVRLQQTVYPMLSIPGGILNPENKNLTQPVVLDILSINESSFKKDRNVDVSHKNMESKKEIKKQVMLQDLLTKYGVTIGSETPAGSEIDMNNVDKAIYYNYQQFTTQLEGKDAPPEEYQALQKLQTDIINETVNKASTFMLSFVSNNVFNKIPLHNKGLEVFNLHNANNLIEQIEKEDGSLPEIPADPTSVWMNNLPNQIKAIFASGAPGSPTRFNFYNSQKDKFNIYGGDDIGKFYFHFQKLVKVEYLVGYQSIKGNASNPCVRTPVWDILDSEAIPESGMILCRLKPYRDRNINDTIKELELPIYNQYFLIGSP